MKRKGAPLGIISSILLILLVLTVLRSGGAAGTGPQLTQRTRTNLLGTVITIATYDNVDAQVLDAALDLVAGIESKMSTNLPDSEISRINASGARETVAVSEETYDLIRRAVALSSLSGGAFDPTVGVVTDLWKVDGVFAVLPRPEEIREKLPLVGYQGIRFSDGGVSLAQDGMMLDLGAIAKGYACDVALEYLVEQGVTSALLDFGGNIYAYGLKPDGSQWKIGVAVPIIGESGSACAVSAQDVSIVTSGGYERYFEEGGTVYHHILNPKTGYPAENSLLSVTILDASSTRADALSTACFVLGLEEGYRLLDEMADCEGIFITKDFEIYCTSGLDGVVTRMDSRFQLMQGAP